MALTALFTIVCVAILAPVTSGFAPLRVSARPVRISLASSSSSDAPSAAAVDEFAEYSLSKPDQGLAFRDTVVGSGTLAEKGKVLCVSYTGRLLATGKQFDEGQYAFRLGEGKVMRGWDRGIANMKVGGKRTLRIPPNMGYGEEGFTFLVPSNAHIEFDIELTSVASNPFEEALALANAQRGRLITIALLLILLAVSPQFS
jgi:FKBP-type peptidyl-prolyl cis-trans isomerase